MAEFKFTWASGKTTTLDVPFGMDPYYPDGHPPVSRRHEPPPKPEVPIVDYSGKRKIELE
jgi:hypothetical protein